MAKVGDRLIGCPYVEGNVGDVVYTEEVLGINDEIGCPAGKFLPGAKIEMKIVKQGKKRKLRIVNFRPQKRHEK